LRRSPVRTVAPGIWEVVSGRVEDGEAPCETARREAYEETGIRVALDERPIIAYQAMYATAPMMVLVYRGRGFSGEICLSSEHDAALWVTGEEFSQLSPLTELVDAARQAEGIPWESTYSHFFKNFKKEKH